MVVALLSEQRISLSQFMRDALAAVLDDSSLSDSQKIEKLRSLLAGDARDGGDAEEQALHARLDALEALQEQNEAMMFGGSRSPAWEPSDRSTRGWKPITADDYKRYAAG